MMDGMTDDATAWTVESGTAADWTTTGPAQTSVPLRGRHAHVELPVDAGSTYLVRIRIRSGQMVAKSWRAGHRERRGGWRSMRSERLSRIRRAYRARQR